MCYPLNDSISSNLEDISRNLCYSSVRSTEWTMLYSGLGIYNHISGKEMKRMFSHFKVKSDDKFLDLLHFTKCVYKKGRPDFLKSLKSSKREKKYIWKSDSFDMEIPVDAQAFSILALTSSSRILKHHEKRLALSMLKSADGLFEFLNKHLKSGEGKFISYENKTPHSRDSLLLKRIEKKANILSQLFVYEAFLSLYNETNNNRYRDYFKNNSLYLSEGRKIFKYLNDHYLSLCKLTSRDLSLAISSLFRCSKLEKDEEYLNSYLHMLNILGTEIDSRVEHTGNVLRNDKCESSSSIITSFRTISALLECYIETGMERFKHSATQIFSNVSTSYDFLTSMFVEKNKEKFSYTSRDISDILRGLLIYYSATEDSYALDMLRSFYKSSIEDSSIIASTPDRNTEFLSHNIKISDSIPLYEQNHRAPVILKGFRVNTKKSPYPVTSRGFNSSYALYSSYMFNFYFSSIIDYKKSLRGDVSTLDSEFLDNIYYNLINQNKNVDENEDIALNNLD